MSELTKVIIIFAILIVTIILVTSFPILAPFIIMIGVAARKLLWPEKYK